MIASSLFQLSLFLSAVAAAPATSALDYNEDHNITSLLEKRFNPVCFQLGGPDGSIGFLDAAYCCRDQLNARGGRGEMCTATSPYSTTTFCDCTVPNGNQLSPRAVVQGLTTGSGHASSNCADVARGMQWIIDNCRTNNPCACGVGGENAAYGNGNLIVVLKGKP
ncbi:hypothetical protein DL546_005860 [Coniochaeta pulveracea]|uniref:Cyanovirin-N domain-containing protein n=1 Tax=Coniochaeta pulveracea TaxID=177199 RepID=A0A420YLU3_9PEZI|nr:hypothetical protein DL546_005860 [Coniochaeta pulveracea]